MRLRVACLLAALLIAFAAVSQSFPDASALDLQQKTNQTPLYRLRGNVIDAKDGRPLRDMSVRVYDGESLIDAATTDAFGRFELAIPGKKLALYVTPWRIQSSEMVIDYGPLIHKLELREDIDLTLRLWPAASVFLEKDIDLVEMEAIPQSVNFTLLDPIRNTLLERDGFLPHYGSRSTFLGIDERQVIVPADAQVKIRVDCRRTALDPKRGWFNATSSFTVDDIPPLTHGVTRSIDVRRYVQQYNLKVIESGSENLKERLRGAEQIGFYVAAEKRDLSRSNILAGTAKEKISKTRFEEAFADLKEAHINNIGLANRIDFLYEEAYWSAIILIAFLAFTSAAIALFLFERVVTKQAAFFTTYVVLLIWFSNIFPGCRLVSQETFLQTSALLATMFCLVLICLSPTAERFRGKPSYIGALFSIAKRNLRRRRIRTIIVMLTIVTLTLSFVALTSFSVEYGLRTGFYNVETRYQGVMVRESNRFGDEFTPFTPLDPSSLPWLARREGVTLIAPKVESRPTLRLFEDSTYPRAQIIRFPLGMLIGDPQRGSHIVLMGLLGILPGAESKTIDLDHLLIGGRFLQDEDVNCVMITAEAARRSGLEIGGELTLVIEGSKARVTLVGLLHDEQLRIVRDLDGEPLLPRYRHVTVNHGELLRDELVYCDPSEIVVAHFSIVQKLPTLAMSRVNILVENPDEIKTIARELALARDYWVWAALGQEVQWLRLGLYAEAKGEFLIIPLLLVILNMATAMFAAVHERRSEVFTLSSLGISPSDIGQIFTAESLVIGLVGVGIGYLLGLSFYRALSFLSIPLEVREKVSVTWSVVTIALALSVSFLSAIYPAKQASLLSTPLRLMRWKLSDKSQPSKVAQDVVVDEEWRIPMPLKVQPNELDGFLRFTEEELSRHNDPLRDHVERIKVYESATDREVEKRLEFRYLFESSTGFGFFISRNALVVRGRNGEPFLVELRTKGPRDKEPIVYKTADFVRKLLLKWSERTG